MTPTILALIFGQIAFSDFLLTASCLLKFNPFTSKCDKLKRGTLNSQDTTSESIIYFQGES